MQLFYATRIVILVLSIGLALEAQTTPEAQTPPGRDVQTETKGLPARATPTDYQYHTQAGAVTIAAEFTGHSLPTLEGPLTTADYVAVEIALFGPAGTQLKISAADFSLRINGKKAALPSQPFGLVASSLRDPE